MWLPLRLIELVRGSHCVVSRSCFPFEHTWFTLRVAPVGYITPVRGWFECVKTVKDPLFFLIIPVLKHRDARNAGLPGFVAVL
jgi:hypothetical protein